MELYTEKPFASLQGETFVRAEKRALSDYSRMEDFCLFFTQNGRIFLLGDSPTSDGRGGCDQAVWLKQIDGDLSDLIGNPILKAERVFESNGRENLTWNFYKLATTKGSVTITFFGQSNGYYSEEASLMEFFPKPPSPPLKYTP